MRCTTVGVLVAIGLVATGCSSDDAAPFWRCTAVDGSGARWLAEDTEGTAALERAMYQCSLEAGDPTRCRPGTCDPVW